MRALAVAVMIVLSGCARKAPGPAECNEFAMRAAGIPPSTAPAQVDPRLRAAVEELTVRCLTTPYDRELLRCAESSPLRACFSGFAVRHPDRAERALPPRRSP